MTAAIKKKKKKKAIQAVAVVREKSFFESEELDVF